MHRRRRTALTVSAALLGAAPLLTACGSEGHPGTAAMVGGERIAVSSLQAQVKDVREAQNGSPQAEQLIQSTGRLPQAKLNSMILDRILERAAADAGVEVSPKDLQTARKDAEQQAGGAEPLQQLMLQQRGVAPDQIDQALREDVLVNKLAAALGADLGTPDGQAKIVQSLAGTSKVLGVEVNPRYGAWDDQKIQLTGSKTPWITQVTKQDQEPLSG
ncbi:SurA N-terminal domain-containing protein [Streptomyces sp. A3M-1-3]|uniref:SurA N-terminal domain-containing protein n=1 Tax=Streptomyces sp. A3M-1-3 TaxID=2962044 RepID=UPI0020B8905F|nr:SurA N-terminal domain-containing protein [Streptomyces sp. A3M-1-3]MCP3820566.1 SurA N-terminal domain-containing protein [Streptomyces sp. A3M-1-3]